MTVPNGVNFCRQLFSVKDVPLDGDDAKLLVMTSVCLWQGGWEDKAADLIRATKGRRERGGDWAQASHHWSVEIASLITITVVVVAIGATQGQLSLPSLRGRVSFGWEG